MNIKPKSSIEIYTDKESYVPGDVVTGKVLLRIKQETKVKELFIALSGDVYCKVHTHGLDKQKGKWIDTNIQEQSKSLFHLKSNLYQFEGGKIKKGEFNVKFNFSLPSQIDYASMHCKGSYGISKDESQHYQQHVRYTLMAWFPAKGKKKKQDVLLGKQTIHIMRQHTFDIPQQVFRRQDFTFCYCFTTGYLDLGLKIQKLYYKASEDLTFEFEYENYPPADRKPISLRYQIQRILIFNGQEYRKTYQQGVMEHFLQKQHKETVTLPLAMTMTHKSQFVEVLNVLQVEYCLPNDVTIPIQQEFVVTHSNPEKKSKQGGGDDDDKDGESQASRLSDANREDIIISEVNWNKCNSKLEEILPTGSGK